MQRAVREPDEREQQRPQKYKADELHRAPAQRAIGQQAVTHKVQQRVGEEEDRDVHPVRELAEHSRQRVEKRRNRDKAQQDARRLDGEEVPERLGKHNKLHHREHEKRDKQQLHVLPGRLVDRRKHRDHAIPARPFVHKVQQRPEKASCDKADNLPSAQLPFHAPSSLSAPVKPGKHYSLRGKEGLYTAKAALNGRLLHFFSYSANRGTMTPAGAFFVSSKEFPSSLWIFFASYSARNSSSVPISG